MLCWFVVCVSITYASMYFMQLLSMYAYQRCLHPIYILNEAKSVVVGLRPPPFFRLFSSFLKDCGPLASKRTKNTPRPPAAGGVIAASCCSSKHLYTGGPQPCTQTAPLRTLRTLVCTAARRRRRRLLQRDGTCDHPARTNKQHAVPPLLFSFFRR